MNILQIFSTPVWEASLPNFQDNKDNFIASAQEFRDQFTEGTKFNFVHNSYQSPPILTRNPVFAPLFDYACQLGLKAAFDLQMMPCDVVVTSAWINIQDSSKAMLLDHVHNDNSVFSGVFYLKIPENSGKLVFSNPGLNQMWLGLNLIENKNKFTSERLQITPVEGGMFLWPSYLPHRTLPNNHEEARISISFNLLTLPKMQMQGDPSQQQMSEQESNT
jgi:uncharacterized protein (TIGR02466 family)